MLEVFIRFVLLCLVEGYYDFLSNKDIHVGISACYQDVLRKCIFTATSHYSLYLNYLRVCIPIFFSFLEG